MLKTINIKVNAAHPEMPLETTNVFTGSAASMTIIDVPRAVGKRSINSVKVSVTNVGGVTTAFNAVRVGSAWEVTIPASSIGASGSSLNGIVICGAGKSETDTDVEQWILGVGDLIVMASDGSVAPGVVRNTVYFFDNAPTTPAKGNIAKIGGVVKIYDGTAWISMGASTDDCVKKTSFALFDDISTGAGTQRELKTAIDAVITNLKALKTAAIAVIASFIICSAFADVTRSTEWQDVPPTTTIGSVVDLGTPGDYYNVSNKSYAAVQYTNGYIDAVNGYKIGEDASITFTNEYMTFYANGAMALRLSNATSYLNGDLAMSDGSGGVLFITDFYNDRYNIISNTVTKSYVESLGIEAGISAATATNIAEAVVENKLTTGYTWSTPDDWAVDVELGKTISPSGDVDVKWDGMMQMSNVVVNITYGQYADCSATLIDESSINPPSIVQWMSLPPGGSITPEGRFTCTNDGIYRIFGKASTGVIRYADIPINKDRVESDVVWSQYIADTNGSVRKAVNDAALATLNSATFVSSNKYEETWYALYNTFVPRMTRTGAGNIAHLAISDHIVASAWHYWPWGLRTGTDTWDDGAGNTSTTTRREWVRLADWALTNGWSEAQIKAMNIDDIAVCRCDKATSIPNGCIPKFMRESTSKAWFGDTLTGVAAWFYGQSHSYAIPCRLSIWAHAPDVISWSASVPSYGSINCRVDFISRLQQMGQQYPAHAGDSGKPVFIMKDGSPIVVSTFYGIGIGPNYIKGFEVLKAFVETYGDTLKEAN